MNQNQKQFVHLHLHTEYSLLDGATAIDPLLKKCKELNMPAVAVTDHGNMYCAWSFFSKAEKMGIKPILGCEFYICDNLYDRGIDKSFERRENHHLILLAKNNKGYQNLCILNSVAFTEGFYRRPRIDFKLLKEHSEGLICLSACIAGELPRLLASGELDEARQVALRYKQLFGEDYYIEIQDHGIDIERMVNPLLVELANELGIKIVATNDVHYLEREDAEIQDIMLCIQTGRYFDETDRMKFFGDSFYFKNYDEMLQLFPNLPQALSNTLEIADKCNVKLQPEELMPLYKFDSDSSQIEQAEGQEVEASDKKKQDFFRKLIEQGIVNRYGNCTQEIRQRVEYEFQTIVSLGFVDYYLIVWDFVNYAKTKGIPVGPGRGSGAGSVVAYCLGITEVEPFRYNLLFERFLNPHRKTNPDFDIDFCMDRRGEVIDYVYKKYGSGKVSQIVTFGTMAAKNAIRDVSRVLRLPINEASRLAKMVPDDWRFSLNHLLGVVPFENEEDTFVSKELQAEFSEEPTKRIIEIARRVDGKPRQTGMHAAGVVICRYPLCEHIPMQTNGGALANGGVFTTQYNMIEVEQVGLLKMDFLGLRTLTDIKKASDYILAETGDVIDFSKQEFNDPKVFQTIASGDTMGIFQLESGGMTNLMKRMQPDGLEDIIAGISLYRPGPMQFIDKYIDGKRNPDKISVSHPMMEEILKVTYGCIVYQEQVMQIVQKLAGFSVALADNVRYAMSKKKEKMMQALGKLFVNGGVSEQGEQVTGCVKNGIDKKTANKIYEELHAFSQYAFNKAHAAGYAYLCYQTAYLKTYYPIQLLCAILNNRLSDIKEIKKYLNYAASKHISIFPPDINKSNVEFTCENGGLRFGLGAIKNIGAAVIESIVNERKNGEFVSMKDLFERCGDVLNKRMIENLIKGGAFDCFGRTRADMYQWFADEQNQVAESVKKRQSGQISIFDMAPELKHEEVRKSVVKEFSNAVKLNFEKEVLGFYMSGSPLDDYDKFNSVFHFNFDTSQLAEQVDANDNEGEEQLFIMDKPVDIRRKQVIAGGLLRDIRAVKGKEGNMMGFGLLEDKFSTIEVALYNPFYERFKTSFAEDAFVVVHGVIADGKDGYKINIKKIVNPYEQVEQEKQTQQLSTAEKLLCINMTKRDDNLFQEVMHTLQQYEGELSVKMKIEGKIYNIPCKVRQCNAILYELGKLLGDENVQFYQKKDNGN